MALICVGSQKGSPGVTLTGLLVAAAWPTVAGRRKLLIEADPDGGSLALRYRLARQPGLVTLAAAGRHGLDREELWSHAQALPGGLAVVVAPERADRASSVLSTSAAPLAGWLASLPDVDVFVDCGRLRPGSPAAPFAREADVVLVVARPVADQVHPAVEIAAGLRREGRAVAWLLIGDRPYGPADVSEATGIPVAGVLPDDPRTAQAFTEGAVSRRARRSLLARAAVTVAAELAARLHTPQPDPSPAEPDPVSLVGAIR